MSLDGTESIFIHFLKNGQIFPKKFIYLNIITIPLSELPPITLLRFREQFFRYQLFDGLSSALHHPSFNKLDFR